jgi:uncharacterized membrane protein
MRLTLAIAASALMLTACKPAEPAPAPAPEPGPAPAPSTPVLNNVDLTQDLRAVGTEPFWAVEIAGDGLKFSGADRPEDTALNSGPTMAPGEAVWSGATGSGKSLKVTLTSGPCSDGMSDRVYPLTARVELGTEKFAGCAANVAQLETPSQ